MPYVPSPMAVLSKVPQRAYLDLSGAAAWYASPRDGRGSCFLHPVCPHFLRFNFILAPIAVYPLSADSRRDYGGTEFLEAAKVEAAIGNRILAEAGLAVGVRASPGHVSMAVPRDPNLFVSKAAATAWTCCHASGPKRGRVRPGGELGRSATVLAACSEVKIHSCIFKNRPDVVSVVHVHPDYVVANECPPEWRQTDGQEGARLVTNRYPCTLAPSSSPQRRKARRSQTSRQRRGLSAARARGVTASTAGVEVAVLTMVHLEHQARLNYMAMCAAGPNHPSIPSHLAEETALDRPKRSPTSSFAW